MNKNLTALTILATGFVFPQLVYACGGFGFSEKFPGSFLVLSTLFAIFAFHGFALYKLNTETSIQGKEVVVKKYSSALFYSHVLFPVLACLLIVFTSVAFACLDSRSQQEKFIDFLYNGFFSMLLTLLFISTVFVLRIRSKKLTVEKKIKLVKITATTMCVISMVALVVFSYSFFFVAPTLSYTPSFLI